MEKTITVDGKDIRFKATGSAAMRYKAQFGKDYFADVAKLNSMEKLMKIDEKDFKPDDLDGVDTTFFFNVAWVFAKTADDSIGDPMAWLDSLDSFPIMDIMGELMGLITSTLSTKKK